MPQTLTTNIPQSERTSKIMPDILDFSPVKRTKAAVTDTDQRPFTQVGVITAVSCGDLDCAQSSPKGLLRKKSSKAGGTYCVCTNNVPNDSTSCQFSASHFRSDPKSTILCLVCTKSTGPSRSGGFFRTRTHLEKRVSVLRVTILILGLRVHLDRTAV